MLREEDGSLLPSVESQDLSSSVPAMQPMNIDLALSYVRWLLKLEPKLRGTVLTNDLFREIYKQLRVCEGGVDSVDGCFETSSATQFATKKFDNLPLPPNLLLPAFAGPLQLMMPTSKLRERFGLTKLQFDDWWAYVVSDGELTALSAVLSPDPYIC
jgi:hypothetical protein